MTVTLLESMNKKKFWDKEYEKPEHLAISSAPSEDLQKFTRWLDRHGENFRLGEGTKVLDLGCGNGRNLIYLAKEFYCGGLGIDSSEEAVGQAKKAAEGTNLTFEVRSMAEPIPLPNNSVDLVLDMMSSHFLKEEERKKLRAEILRVLKPGGFLFFKTFLLEGDQNALRMIRDYPAGEKNSYIHPTFGGYEHVFTNEELPEFFEPEFEIKRVVKSHKHFLHGKAFKRRTMSVYLEKI